MTDHLEHVAIPTGALERWHDIAADLGLDGITLAGELRLVGEDPSRHNLGRVLRLARWLKLGALVGEIEALI